MPEVLPASVRDFTQGQAAGARELVARWEAFLQGDWRIARVLCEGGKAMQPLLEWLGKLARPLGWQALQLEPCLRALSSHCIDMPGTGHRRRSTQENARPENLQVRQEGVQPHLKRFWNGDLPRLLFCPWPDQTANALVDSEAALRAELVSLLADATPPGGIWPGNKICLLQSVGMTKELPDDLLGRVELTLWACEKSSSVGSLAPASAWELDWAPQVATLET